VTRGLVLCVIRPERCAGVAPANAGGCAGLRPGCGEALRSGEARLLSACPAVPSPGISAGWPRPQIRRWPPRRTSRRHGQSGRPGLRRGLGVRLLDQETQPEPSFGATHGTRIELAPDVVTPPRGGARHSVERPGSQPTEGSIALRCGRCLADLGPRLPISSPYTKDCDTAEAVDTGGGRPRAAPKTAHDLSQDRGGDPPFHRAAAHPHPSPFFEYFSGRPALRCRGETVSRTSLEIE
jgi:hypothetical protein